MLWDDHMVSGDCCPQACCVPNQPHQRQLWPSCHKEGKQDKKGCRAAHPAKICVVLRSTALPLTDICHTHGHSPKLGWGCGRKQMSVNSCFKFILSVLFSSMSMQSNSIGKEHGAFNMNKIYSNRVSCDSWEASWVCAGTGLF